MLDFNTKKNILKKLSDCAEKNFLMLVPCIVAAALVKLFYFIVCNIDIALSDKDGHFLGIKKHSRIKAKKQKKDDIVYVKRPVAARLVSALLSLSFAATFMPAVEVFAGESDYLIDPATGYSYDSSITLASPTILSDACVSGYGAYKVSWSDNAATADGYAVYYKAANGIETLAKEYSGTSVNYYIITGLSPTVSYTFSVKAIKKIPLYKQVDDVDTDGKPTGTKSWVTASGTYKLYSAADTIIDTPNTVLSSPDVSVYYRSTELTADSIKKVFITLNSGVSDADGYLIYRKNVDKATADTLLATISASSISSSTPVLLYTDESSLDKTTLYSYVVLAYKDVFNLYGTDSYKESNSAYYVKSTATNNYREILTDTATPTNLKVNSKSETSITVTWTKVNNATGYYLYRYTEDEVKAAGTSFALDTAYRISTLAGTVVSYTDTEVENKVTYYYYISAYRTINDGGNDHESLPVGATGSLNTTIYAPQGFYGTPDDGKITLTWTNTDTTVAGFEIEYTKIADKDGNAIANPIAYTVDVPKTPCKYDHLGLHNGETYIYRIRSYKVINDVKEPISDYVSSEEIVVGARFSSPQDLTVTPADGSMGIKWSAVKGAEGYFLYITKNNDDGSTTEYAPKEVSGTSYTHTNLKNGEKYSYYVVAFKTVTGDTIESNKSETITATVGVYFIPPNDISAVASDGFITLNWTAVKGAEGYIIYATGGSGTATSLTINTTKTSYIHSGLTNGETWTYYVKSYKFVNGEQVLSDPSNTVTATVGVILNAPADLIATPSDGQVALSWTAVKGAEGYIVYASNGSSTEQFNVTKTNYIHTGLLSGSAWTYYVKAYKTVNGARVYSGQSLSVSTIVGTYLAAPTDFVVTTADASATLKWTAVKGAEGYVVYAYSSGASTQFDVSKTTYTHTGLENGTTWNYYVKAFKTVNNSRVYSNPTTTISVKIGAALSAPPDLVATSGNRQIDLSWSAVKGAEGYIVYLYDSSNESFMPLSVVSKTQYSHTALKNGTKYTYMVAAYKYMNGEKIIGDYSMAVSAIPSSGTAADVDSTLNIKGTAPYGISHSELISAAANHDAFDESVDVYFSVNEESTKAIKEVLKHYANGLSSFIIYPFDIAAYLSDTLVSVDPNDGYSITFTMPVPDKLIQYRDYITVVHIPTDGVETITDDDSQEIFLEATDLEVLPSALIQINDHWCIQFTTTSCSPFALVIYKDNIFDISSGAASNGGGFAGNFNTGLLLFTVLPDIMPNDKKTKFVVSTKKYYRIKK